MRPRLRQIFSRRPVPSFLTAWCTLLAPTLAARAWTAWEMREAGLSMMLFARGALSDSVLCAVLAIPAAFAPRIVRVVFTLVWCFLLAGNREFILANGANIGLVYLADGEQQDFLAGSVLIGAMLLSATVFLAIALGAAVLTRAPSQRLRRAGRKTVWLACVVLFLYPLYRDGSAWLQQHYLEENLREWFYSGADSVTISPRIREAVRKKYFVHDLSGERIVNVPLDRPNILFIVVEGLSDWHVEQGMLPFVAQWREDTLYYPRFIAQNRQTHTGIHALLCGEYPNLSVRKSKAEILVREGARRPCLPEVLRDAGYYTVFMQAASLAFMRKDLIAARMGFMESHGKKQLPHSPSHTNWGLSDRMLYQHVLEKLRQLEADGKPWFMTVLTVGTHHPFRADPENAKRWGGAQKAVYHMAGEALEYLVTSLEAEGLLDRTLLILTSDESNARIITGDTPAGQLPGNHGMLLVRTPDGERGENPGIFAQSDMLLSVLDYLNMPSKHYYGRSVFRRYDTGRAIPFANIYLRRYYLLDPDGLLTVCTADVSRCRRYGSLEGESGDLFAGRFIAVDTKHTVQEAKALAMLSDTEEGVRKQSRVVNRTHKRVGNKNARKRGGIRGPRHNADARARDTVRQQ